jgi:hypothetical protein
VPVVPVVPAVPVEKVYLLCSTFVVFCRSVVYSSLHTVFL